MFDSFIFKDVTLSPGDRISMVAKSVPVPCFQAAVSHGDASSLTIFSTQLAIFQHSGNFPAEDVEWLTIDYPAEQAVPLESRAELRYCQRVTAPRVSGDKELYVMAAFDGFVMAFDKTAPPDEAYVAGGSSYFVPV